MSGHQQSKRPGETKSERLAAARARREAGFAEAMRVLATTLHEQFCDDDQLVGGWDEAVVLNVLTAYEALPPGLHSCVLATLALRSIEPTGEAEPVERHQ